MNKVLSVAALVVVSNVAYAQSSVTLFGTIGGGVRWTNGLKGGSSVGFDSNTLYGNEFGFWGKEDLGNGLTALFMLDGGFSTGNGTTYISNALFSNAAYVGLQGKFGKLTLGRQINASTDFGIMAVDPLYGRAKSFNVEPGVPFACNFFTLDSRFNNTIKYTGRIGGLTFIANYSPGGIAGNSRAGTNYAATAMYQYQLLIGGVSYSRTYSPDGKQTAQSVIAGGSVQLGTARLYAAYTQANISAATAPNPSRTDKIPELGVVYQATPTLSFTAAAYYDIARNLSNVRGADGHKLTTYAMAEYALSKRTSVYVEVDRNQFSGSYRNDPVNIAALGMRAGGSGVTGATVGLTTRF
ncbi:porin [Burkholderia arboris]|uniref:porin n=1 Tax=Burkholderia arboris TaxID=488730 RepID=UPI001CF52E0E|nr:porin [Burkholderia arboris]MCA8052352.1 porin [Burkholderia arboris]